jgi:hypothetical protein
MKLHFEPNLDCQLKTIEAVAISFAGPSDNVNARQMELFKENIAHLVRGEPLANVVDKQKGY